MYRALLICNSIYEDATSLPRLRGPQVDGFYLWRQLSDPQSGMFRSHDIELLQEREKHDVLQAIESFFQGSRPGDTSLLYFSGHGLLTSSDDLYLCVRDTSLARIRSTGVSCDEISQIVSDSKAELVIILLDCCYSGSFKGQSSPKLDGEGRYVISATRSIEEANDSTESGYPSPFTETLIKSLAISARDLNDDGLIDLDDVMRDLEREWVAGQPVPKRKFDGAGRVNIAKRLAIPSIPNDETNLSGDGSERALLVYEEPFNSGNFLTAITTRRRSGDITVGDFRDWIVSAAIGSAMIISSLLAASDFDFFYPEIALMAAVLGVMYLVVALAQWPFRYASAQHQSRRFLLQQRSASMRIKIANAISFLAVLPALSLLFVALQGNGPNWPPYWTIAITLAGLMALIPFARLSNWGDSAFLCGSLVLFGSAFIPLWGYDSNLDERGFLTGFETPGGVLRAICGGLLLAAWSLRLPPVVSILISLTAFLSLLTSGYDALFPRSRDLENFRWEPDLHWVVSAVAVTFVLLCISLGAGKLIPLRGSEN